MVCVGDSPVPVAKGEVKWIRLSRLARLGDETIWVEQHGFLVDIRVVHEVSVYSREWLASAASKN